MVKTFITSKNDIDAFLKSSAAEYDLHEISNSKALLLHNNIEQGGRVANFIIDKYDIAYFNDILKKIDLYDNEDDKININGNDQFNYLMNTVIEKLIQWIQLRLNTKSMYQHNYWDFLNMLYTQKCFNKENFIDLAKIGSNTNIRNLYFGDCREHEVLLHVLLKLYLTNHKLNDKYKIYKFYAYGSDVIHLSANSIFSHKIPDNKITKIRNVGGAGSLSEVCPMLPNIDDVEIRSWEHTHPILYREINNEYKLISLDALGHKTFINTDLLERHNSFLNIEKKTKTDKILYKLWYDLVDKKSRIYVETPTPFSNQRYSFIKPNDNENGLIYGFNVNKNLLFNNSQFYTKQFELLNLDLLNPNSFMDDAIELLCSMIDK